MRVTKAIREYVEDEISKKYDEASYNIGKTYEEERSKVIERVKEFAKEAEVKAKEYIESVGYSYKPSYRSEPMFTLYGNIGDFKIEEALADKRSKLRAQRNVKIRQVLFDLEMGETAKAELKEVLDNIVVE